MTPVINITNDDQAANSKHAVSLPDRALAFAETTYVQWPTRLDSAGNASVMSLASPASDSLELAQHEIPFKGDAIAR